MISTKKAFLGNDFLLNNETAQVLYDEYASPMPIIDYHCHLSPQDIAENRKFKNLTEIWLDGDHYKWRAMRTNGVPEHFCTGKASPLDKFKKWAETVPYTLRNPLYHWTHLELKNYFGITTLLDGSSAEKIFQECTAQLQQENFRVLGLLEKMKVEVVCTTDDPSDDLGFHQDFRKKGEKLKMFPTFRPDKSFAVETGEAYVAYLKKLAQAASTEIKNVEDLLMALRKRIDFFCEMGAKASDHGLQQLYFESCDEKEAQVIFEKVRSGKSLMEKEIHQFKFFILSRLSQMYHEVGWVQQFHLGAMRNNSDRMMKNLGPDTGFDSIGDYRQAEPMSEFFNFLDATDQLTKTVLYNLNPSDNALFATMTGNFNDGSIPGKMQFGSGWWFLDQKDGMVQQMNALSNMGLISRFLGMLTDSRSFLSFPRHEYFRRILCNLFGTDIEQGELPDDLNVAGKIIQNICYWNTKNFFGF